MARINPNKITVNEINALVNDRLSNWIFLKSKHKLLVRHRPLKMTLKVSKKKRGGANANKKKASKQC